MNIFDVISFLGNEGLVRMFFIVDLIGEEDRIRSEEGYWVFNLGRIVGNWIFSLDVFFLL